MEVIKTPSSWTPVVPRDPDTSIPPTRSPGVTPNPQHRVQRYLISPKWQLNGNKSLRE